MDGVFFQIIGNDWWSWIAYLVFFMVFLFFYPRLMMTQILYRLEKSAQELEEMSKKSKVIVISEISKKPSKVIKESIDRFFEFFMIQPVSLDPYGIVRKFDHIIQGQRDRFRYFVKQIAPKMDEEKQACIQMGLAGGITVHEISKIVRHYVELVKKTKSLQIAMILQMQMPMIERMAKALFKGTKSLSKGEPIGDGLGPLVVADMIKTKPREIEDNIVMSRAKVNGRDLFLLKARGPGGRLGRPGRAVEKIIKSNKIARVITIDAAAKLEGERTGSLAEGVGVAMGGPGVEKSYIEDIVVRKSIPLDSIVIKMSQEESITPMRKVIKDSIPKVMESLNRSLERVRPGEKVIVVGVGNTSGIGDTREHAKSVRNWIDKYDRRMKAKRTKKRRRRFI